MMWMPVNEPKSFVGQPVSQADAALGEPVEVLSDTRSTRTWRLYKVPMDAMDTARYVLEVEGTRILAVSKVQQYTDPRGVPGYPGPAATESHGQVTHRV